VLAHFDTSFGGSHFTRELASQVFMIVDKDLGGTVDRAEFFEMVNDQHKREIISSNK
jgi:hypothetical protein